MNEYLAVRKKALQAFAKSHGLRDDWHEPDNQGVIANIVGADFDNAIGDDPETGEIVVILHQDARGEGTLCINLATLLAIACQP